MPRNGASARGGGAGGSDLDDLPAARKRLRRVVESRLGSRQIGKRRCHERRRCGGLQRTQRDTARLRARFRICRRRLLGGGHRLGRVLVRVRPGPLAGPALIVRLDRLGRKLRRGLLRSLGRGRVRRRGVVSGHSGRLDDGLDRRAGRQQHGLGTLRGMPAPAADADGGQGGEERDRPHPHAATPHQSRMRKANACAVAVTEGRCTRSSTPWIRSASGP